MHTPSPAEDLAALLSWSTCEIRNEAERQNVAGRIERLRDALKPRFTLDEFVNHLRLVPPGHLIGYPGKGYTDESGEFVEIAEWHPDVLEYLRPHFHNLKQS